MASSTGHLLKETIYSFINQIKVTACFQVARELRTRTAAWWECKKRNRRSDAVISPTIRSLAYCAADEVSEAD